MKFGVLAGYFERLEATTKRLEMFDILAELFARARAVDIDKIVYLTQGQLTPPFLDVETGISDKLLVRAISEASDRPTREVEGVYRETGDLGETAARLLRGSGELKVGQVYDELMAIARTGGRGSVEAKMNLLSSLLRGVSPFEAKYVARFIVGRLRLGIGDPTVLEALALSEGDRELRKVLERAYNLCSDLGLVARTLKSEGLGAVERFRIRVGYPVRMALCERLPSAEEVIKKMGKVAVEAKYDGFRCQVHKDGKRVEIFSRNLERTTPMFPEISKAASSLGAKTAIFEGEALAFNEATGELFPFQVTMQRKRKHGVMEMAKEYPLRFFAFDLLLLEGEDLTEKPYIERRRRLEKLVASAGGGVIEPARMFVTDDPGEIHRHFEEFVETGLEGVVAKRLDGVYAAGSRNFNWIKLKRVYRGELSDTVDLCVVGYFRGRGARARFGLGGVLGAVYDPESDTFKTVSKVGSGFTEEEFARLKEILDKIAIDRKHPRVDSVIEADVWVEPRYVLTVYADEITRSPLHTAGRDESGVGYALRFPRAVEFLRTDKAAEDANTVAEIIEMERQQKQVKVR
ncbi:MAG: ATP-dependent DNA ligase [Nitrospirota bacterium]